MDTQHNATVIMKQAMYANSNSSAAALQRSTSSTSHYSCSSHLRRLALCVFEKFTSPIAKGPLPKYSNLLVQLSEGRGPFVFGSLAEQNQWLAQTIVSSLVSGPSCISFLKTLMLLHDVLVQGAPEFVDAFRPFVEQRYDVYKVETESPVGVFDLVSLRFNHQSNPVGKPNLSVVRLVSAAEACSDPKPTEPLEHHVTAARFFSNYIHALFEFQVRHRPMGNLLKASSVELVTTLAGTVSTTRVDPNHPGPVWLKDGEKHPADDPQGIAFATWTPIYRDVSYSCMTLIKYIVAAQTCIPQYCFVTAEIFRRYIVDCCHLYQLTSRVLQHSMLSARTCKYYSKAEGKKSMAAMVQYHRVTLQMEQFFEHLRSLKNDTVFDLSALPPRFDALPKAIGEYVAYKTKMMKDAEEIQVESLDSVLTRATSSSVTAASLAGVEDPAGTTRKRSGSEGMDASTNQQLLTDSDKSSAVGSSGVVGGSARPTALGPKAPLLDDFQSEALTIDIPAVEHSTISSNEDAFSTAQSFFNEGMNIVRTPADRMDFCPSKFDVQDSAEDVDEAVEAKRLLAQEQLHIEAANRIRQGSGETTFLNQLEPGTAKREIQMRTSFMKNGSDTNVDEDDKYPAAQRFHVLDQILGQGGFGTVYKAWDEEEGRHVACKEVKLVETKTAIHELYKEYRVLTTLEHPNIVKVLGFVVHQGHGRIFMEWVPSGSVQSVLQETKRGLRETIVRRYVREALQGLVYLHSRGIVHRDVKPGNMLLASDGTVKLTDFGTSRTLEHAAETVQTGTVVGTVPYLAPECVRGTYSAASDVWALGCTALHMITGKAPWAGEARDNVSLIFKLGNLTDPTVVTGLVAGVEQAALHDFISSAMTLDRHHRPTAAALLSHPFLAAQ
ncbi:protein kinase, putative [Bodo saltans]|uniref:Protein kinase, putative n=1 Tax=Bodo saltans TaxID=75058 RepID=A0A0S4JKH7_BODSA|nr:protein kinase, putative [Bodo saltans]|eukprot:CUG92008.1 protein kinase, putative [Bodo saltans]